MSKGFKNWRDIEINNKQAHYPERVLEAIYCDKPLSFEEFLLYKNDCSSRKVMVKIICEVCGSVTIRDFKQLKKPKLIAGRQLCSQHAIGEATKTEEWRKSNSKAQKIAQSKPEQRIKNSEGVKRFWRENPQVKEKMIRSVTLAYQRKDIREKHGKSLVPTRGISGLYLMNNEWVSFESIFELRFLLWAENQSNFVSCVRPDWYIIYEFEGRSRRYHPDYILRTNDETMLVELKGSYYYKRKQDREKAKVVAAREYVRNSDFLDRFMWIGEGVEDKEFTKESRKSLLQRLYLNDKIKLSHDKHIERYLGAYAKSKEC